MKKATVWTESIFLSLKWFRYYNIIKKLCIFNDSIVLCKKLNIKNFGFVPKLWFYF